MNLQNPRGATMEAGPARPCNPDDATGFIRLNVLRLKVAVKVNGNELACPGEKSTKPEGAKPLDPSRPHFRRFNFDD
jgi:hypothetical protein